MASSIHMEAEQAECPHCGQAIDVPDLNHPETKEVIRDLAQHQGWSILARWIDGQIAIRQRLRLDPDAPERADQFLKGQIVMAVRIVQKVEECRLKQQDEKETEDERD